MHAVSPDDDQEGGADRHHEAGHDGDDRGGFTFLQWHTIISTALFDISGLFLVVVLIHQLTGRMNLYCN